MWKQDARAALRETATGLVDLLYPPKCLVCERLGDARVCSRCLSDFVPAGENACAICGSQESNPSRLNREVRLCAACAEADPRHFRSAQAAGLYADSLRLAIHALKYEGRRGLGAYLGQWVAGARPSLVRRMHPDIVVPVPLHWLRRRMRGFNQSELIAQGIAETTGWTVRTDVLARVRWTRPQVSLDAEHRAANVRNAFSVRRPEDVIGCAVVLVDDVLTTLHTVDECARVLVGAGATSVDVLAVAR